MMRHPLKLSKEEYINYQSETPPVNDEEKKYIENMVKERNGMGGSVFALLGLNALKAANAFSTLLKSFEGPCPMTFNLMSSGRPHTQVKLTADGWAQALGLAFNY